MLNIDDFIKRLEQVMLFYSLSGGAFADRIGIQRSSLSHLLSGRNKPSLEFVMKIVSELPEVDLNWILNGSGVFPKSNQKINISPAPVQPAVKLLFDDDGESAAESTTLFNTEPANASATLQKQAPDTPLEVKSDLIVEKIVIFYTNGTFIDYKKGIRSGD